MSETQTHLWNALDSAENEKTRYYIRQALQLEVLFEEVEG